LRRFKRKVNRKSQGWILFKAWGYSSWYLMGFGFELVTWGLGIPWGKPIFKPVGWLVNWWPNFGLLNLGGQLIGWAITVLGTLGG